MPCTSHHSLHCWKLPSRIRTPLSTCLDTTVDIVEIDEGTEVKARTDGRRTRIGGTEVPGPGPRGRVAHERIVPLGRVVVEHSIGDGVTVIGAATHRYDPFAVYEGLFWTVLIKEFFVAPNDHQGSAELPEIELKKQ